jgi:hypothetical protein
MPELTEQMSTLLTILAVAIVFAILMLRPAARAARRAEREALARDAAHWRAIDHAMLRDAWERGGRITVDGAEHYPATEALQELVRRGRP